MSVALPEGEDACNVPLPQTPSNDAPSIHPSSIPLPPSSSTLNLEVSAIHKKLASYKARTTHLSDYFPHLNNVCSRSRHDKADITVLDYADSRLRRARQLQVEFETEKIQRQARIEDSLLFMCATSLWPEVKTRLIILEDIGPTIMNLLGAIFELSPEFFAEHLHQSGYRGHTLHELSPSAWRTSNLRKDYVSMEWRRPVRRWLQEPITPSQRTDLLGLQNPRLEGSFGGSETAKYWLETTTNIFRPEFAMYTNPDGQLPETTPSGWEERVTVGIVELDGLRYVIILLDPLPLLKKTIEGSSGDPKFVRELELLDENHLRERLHSNCKSRSEIMHLYNKTSRRMEILSPFTQLHARTPWTLDYRSLFRQPSEQATVQELHDKIPCFQSTKEALERCLLSAPSHEVQSYTTRLGPASMIFRIVHQDTLDLLQLMRLAFAEFELASSDSVLQERALHWRYRLDQFRAHLIVLEASLQDFVRFIQEDPTATRKHRPSEIGASSIEDLLSDILHQINLHKERITQAYSSLTSKVQISDSHRSIAEAETVTKLTELAFFFIPLSFATSIFGMQIIDGSTPTSTYIAVAVAFTSAAYLLRFLIYRTTERRVQAAQMIRNRIVAYAKLRSGSRIPTAVALRWLYHVFAQIALRLRIRGTIILTMAVVLLPIIWTSDIDRGIQIAISCLLVSAPICTEAFLFMKRSSTKGSTSEVSTEEP